MVSATVVSECPTFTLWVLDIRFTGESDGHFVDTAELPETVPGLGPEDLLQVVGSVRGQE